MESRVLTVARLTLNTLAIGVLLFFAIINAVDLVQFLHTDGADYPIGAEAAGFRYKTGFHYLGLATVSLVMSLVGLVGPVAVRRGWHRTAARGTIAAMLVVEAVWLISTGD